MAGVDVPIRPSPGVMLAVRGRLCNMVVNRLHASGDGDIVVPQRALSVVGTSSWVVEDPDDLGVPEDHVRADVRRGREADPRRPRRAVPRRVVGRPAARSAREDDADSRARALADLQDDRPRRGPTASRASSRSPAARARPSAAWPSCAPTSSAASSASTSRAARARPSCSPTRPLRRMSAPWSQVAASRTGRRAGSVCTAFKRGDGPATRRRVRGARSDARTTRARRAAMDPAATATPRWRSATRASTPPAAPAGCG